MKFPGDRKKSAAQTPNDQLKKAEAEPLRKEAARSGYVPLVRGFITNLP